MTLHSISRRRLLQTTGVSLASLPLASLNSVSAACLRPRGEDKPLPALVTIFLRGGADAMNIVVPYGTKRYYDIRPTLAIPPPKSEGGALKLDKKFGLHPALVDLMPYWEAEQLAPIVCVGSPHSTRSHFDAQDFMERAAPGLRTVHDGWLNRYLALSHDARKPRRGEAEKANILRAIAMQGLLPRALRGPHAVLAVPSRRVLNDDATLAMFGPLYGNMADDGMDSGISTAKTKGGIVYETGRNTMATMKRFREIVEDSKNSGKVRYPGGSLGDKLKDVARVIRADEGFEVAALDIGGWDTHSNQGGSEGNMANRLANLGGSLAAFMTDLGPHLENTTVMVMSEFGRTCRENGNYGTDHGHGGMMLVMGGGVEGGKVLGKWKGLEDDDLYQARDLDVTTDFRDVFYEVLRRHMDFEVPRDFFPGYKPDKVNGLMS